MRLGVLLIILLLAVPIVLAIGSATPANKCRLASDCYKLMRSGNFTCEPGFVRDYSAKCQANQCVFCKPASVRIIRQCRMDTECPTKLKCSAGLTAQCVAMQCTCAKITKPQCYTNNDCTRQFLGNSRQKIVCQRGQCVIPQPVPIALPWYTKLPANITK